MRTYGWAMTDPDLQIRGWGGGGLGEVLQEKEKRALGNKTACILSFFLNGTKIEGVVLNTVRPFQTLSGWPIHKQYIDLARAKSELSKIFKVCSNKIMFSAKRRRNENGEKTTIGLIGKKTTLHVQHTFLYISLPLFCTTTTWNFQKLPFYSFYGGNVVLFTFFHSLIFTLVVPRISHFLSAAKKISCCSSNKWLLIFRSSSLSLFFSLSFAGLSPTLSYSNFVDMTINLSLMPSLDNTDTETISAFHFFLYYGP